jgi:hypothetical protein
MRPKDSEELHGAWVNTYYNTVPGLPAKRIFNPDGTWAKYEMIDTGIWISGTFSVRDKWTDGRENVLYRILALNPRTGSCYFLVKISISGTIELLLSRQD